MHAREFFEEEKPIEDNSETVRLNGQPRLQRSRVAAIKRVKQKSAEKRKIMYTNKVGHKYSRVIINPHDFDVNAIRTVRHFYSKKRVSNSN